MTGLPGVERLAGTIGLAFLTGTLLLGVLSFLPRSRTTARRLWGTLLSEALILLGGVLPWLMPPTALFGCLLAAAGRIGFESGTVHGAVLGRRLGAAGAVLLTAAAVAGWLFEDEMILWGAILLLAGAIAVLVFSAPTSLEGRLARFVIFPLLPVIGFAHAAGQPQFAPVMVLAFLLVEVFDSFALLGGRLYGRSPLLPRLSPRKTWEGLATGAAALFAVAAMLKAWFGLPLLPLAICAVTVSLAAVAGDILASMPKRQASVKDYPPVIRVQGGLLDIMDAWLVAAPCLVALLTLTGWA